MFNWLHLPSASTFASEFNSLFGFIFWISVVGFLAVVFALAYFLVRYRRRRSAPNTTPYIEGHTVSELGVASILTVLVMIIFAWGWKDYERMITTPSNTMEINVVGKQWSWDVQYTNGRRFILSKEETGSTSPLVVPLGVPVQVILSSEDVIHSFYVPAFRVKQDALRNQYTKVWFEATQAGDYPLFCAEYCGLDHSQMLGTVRVVSLEDFKKWQAKWEFEQKSGTKLGSEENNLPADKKGEKVFVATGCQSCHTVTGTPLVGPTLKGVFGHEVELEDGSKVMADENYIRESILNPNAKVVKGFPKGVMSTYKGLLSDDEINSLVAYIKSLGK